MCIILAFYAVPQRKKNGCEFDPWIIAWQVVQFWNRVVDRLWKLGVFDAPASSPPAIACAFV